MPGVFISYIESAFQVTNWLNKPGDCYYWQDHFQSRSIPVAIVQREETPRFSLWRHGKEVANSKDNVFYLRAPWYDDYRVIHASSGFLSAMPGKEVKIES